MKAGGVYVPLDPNSPANRLAYITRNCNIKVLLTSSEKIGTLSEFFVEGTPVETGHPHRQSEPVAPVTLPEQVQLVAWDDIQAQPDEAVPARESIGGPIWLISFTPRGPQALPKG